MKRFDAIIFDIDNVLVDTRASYTDCIRKTVQTYLESASDLKPSSAPLLTRRDVERFKSLGGFNDDWDTCYGLLLYLLSLPLKTRSIAGLRRKKNIRAVLKQFHRKQKTLGIAGLKREIARRHSGVPPISFPRITDMFQRFYLSEFVWKEKLIVSRNFLKSLKNRGIKIGIVTGRNREEADFALKRFHIISHVDAMITLNDTPKAFKKPHPYGLLKVTEALGKTLRFLYVGDLPDDIISAQRAKRKIEIASCGFLSAANSPREMKRALVNAGADFICRSARELKTVINLAF